ncbi:MAG TPA: GIY-YIG nuclease family protein [Terriglobales bacterium]|nr:GIY-YIG nuclease family protein [Terriglobales bacterium]
MYAVYILTNASRRPFYVGFTGRLRFRTAQHKQHAFRDSYSAHYNLHRLVYFELFYDPYAAIAREKELKGWSRMKKIALVEKVNPKWDDLSREWEKACALQPQGPSSLLAR